MLRRPREGGARHQCPAPKAPSCGSGAGREAVFFACRPVLTTAVSVTGRRCQLDCSHCGGHYLAGMYSLGDLPPPTPGASYLVSGGCDAEGRVPLLEHWEQVTALAHRGRLNVHTGLVLDPEQASMIADVADVISFDLIGSTATIAAVMGTGASADDYLRSYRLLAAHGTVYPHICIGLHAGQLVGERAAIEMLADESPAALVFLVLMPTVGTRFQHCTPPDHGAVAELIGWARGRLPTTRLVLGCMRPAGSYRRALDVAAVLAGVDGIVKPHPAAVAMARQLGRRVVEGTHCCSLELSGTALKQTGRALP